MDHADGARIATPHQPVPQPGRCRGRNRLATHNTRPANLYGQCGISLPIQHLGADLPVGLQLVAARGADARLLQVACAVEQVLGS